MKDEYAAIAPVYDAWASRMEGDVEFYVRCAQESGGPVVELGVGNGRVAIPIAVAGIDVIGVDVSEAMLAMGASRAGELGVGGRISWVLGDMRTFVADPPVSLVTIPFRSFVHLTTTEDQLATLRCVRRSLLDGGRLILNLFVPDPAFIAANDGVRRLVAETTDDRGRRVEIWNRTTYDMVTQGMRVGVIREAYEGERLADVSETVLDARMVYRYEMEHLLARSGFRVRAVHGDFDEGPLDEAAREMIWVAEAA